MEEDWTAAAGELVARDPAFRQLVAAVGPPALRPPQEGYFAALVRSIAFQQLAGPAATAIHGRFVAALEGSVTPEAVMALPEADVRAAGMSRGKTASIRELAARFLDGTIPTDGLDGYADDEIVTRLATVRGIGRWTGEMFLIFQLRRPDVWPVDDLGVRKGYGMVHGLAAPPTPRELRSLGDPFRPWRTVAAWYCWQANHTVVPAEVF
jgi:DNA-3-methyladenine glycosylase II